MTNIKRSVLVSIVFLFLWNLPVSLFAQDTPIDNTQDVIAQIKEQNAKLSKDLRRIHREIAALRADLDKPDVKDIFGGIGYILGLCGAAALVAARRRERHA
jgi:nickel transport protein